MGTQGAIRSFRRGLAEFLVFFGLFGLFCVCEFAVPLLAS